EPVRLHLEGGAARAVAGAQESETSLGWTARGSLELGLTHELGAQVELSTVMLAAGDPPSDPMLAPKSASSGPTLMVGLRARPFATSYAGRRVSAAGLWFDANGGAARTGELTRGAFDAHVGFDVLWDRFGVGPYAGYLHVFQPDDTLRPDDARIV